MRRVIALLAVAGVLFGIRLHPANAAMPTVTETYDISPVACNGLSLNGVQYSFSIGGVASGDCVAGTLTGPGTTNNIDSPNIEGNASGVLTLTFDVPTTQFSFGVAQNTLAGPQEVTVDLYRPGAGLLRESVELSTTNDPLFVGGLFTYKGPAVKTVSISFSNPGGRFAIDNTTYFRPPGRSD